MRRLLSGLLTAAAGMALVAGAAAAPAGATEMTAQANVCGSSYVKIDTYPIKYNATTTYGNIELYYSASAKRNCAVTVGVGATYGWKGYKSIEICPNGTDITFCGMDSGNYLYYAGPVYTKAGHDMSEWCVDVVGMIQHPNGTSADNFREHVHCG
jgi:hypothetical protein